MSLPTQPVRQPLRMATRVALSVRLECETEVVVGERECQRGRRRCDTSFQSETVAQGRMTQRWLDAAWADCVHVTA